MGFLSRLVAGGLEGGGVPGPMSDFWYQPVGALTPSGARVDAEGAQKLSAWYRGRDILATVLAMLPCVVYQKLPNDGGAEPALDHPLYDLLHDQPNDYQDSFQWRRAQMFDLIDHGHAYDWIVPGARGFVHQLCPIDPTLVTPKQQARTLANGAMIPGRMLYDIRDAKTGRTQTFTQDEVFHLRGAGGKGILEYARTSLGTALATENYAATVFGRGALNGGIIENPGTLDPEASKRMALSMITAAGDWRLPKVLEQGSTFKEPTMSPEDFQMLLSRRFSIDDMARWLGVPRTMLENSDPSYGNAEQFDQNFLTYSMGNWTSLWEFGIKSQLILKPRIYYAEFTRDAIARAKFLERAQGNVAYVNAGIYSVDEVRGHEGKNKRGGKADELRDPQNITGKPAANDPPPASPTKPPASKPDPYAPRPRQKAEAIVVESAARVLRKEVQFATRAAVKWADDPAGWMAAVDAFYADHHLLVMQTMLLAESLARAYVAIQRADLHDGLAVTEAWTPDYLASLALDMPTPDPLPGLLKAALEQPAPDIHVPVTIAKGAIVATVQPAKVTVSPAPVTIHHDAHLTVPTSATAVVTKTVQRDAVGQIASVTETHAATPLAPAQTIVKTVKRNAKGQIARVDETRTPTTED